MINTLISALTLTAKLGICIAVFAVLIVAEILALVMLVKWKKNYKSADVKNDVDSVDDKLNNDAAIAQIQQDEVNSNNADDAQQAVEEATDSSNDDVKDDAESVQSDGLQEENADANVDAETSDADAVEATEDIAAASEEGIEEGENKTDKWSAFAFAPMMMLSAAAQVTSIRYLLYALIGVAVVLGAAVLITAIAFSKSLTKAPKEQEVKQEQPQQEAQPQAEVVEEAVEEQVVEPVEEPVESIEEAEEEQNEQEVLEQEQLAEEPEIAAEETQPVVDEEVTVDVVEEAEPVVEEQPAEEPVVEEEIKVEAKPVKEPVKRVPPAREQTIIVDDKPVLIKDDRFLFNPEEDGYYYVLEKTFTAKLIQSEEYVKDYYTELKNELLSYKKVHARMSKKRESFNFGRNCLARLTIRGKTLRLHLALDANDYEDTKYKVEDTSEIKSLADTALMYRIKNDRRVKYAKDLIAAVMAKYGVERQEIEPIDYTPDYPYETTEALLARGLIIKRRVKGKMPENKGFDFAQKTFKAKLIQSDDIVKEYYSQIKNYLLSFKKVHDRMSKKRESFRFGRTCVARMTIRGKTIKLYLALNAADYEDTKYIVEDASDVKSYADTPLVIKLKNNRRVKYAKELIDEAMWGVGAIRKIGQDETDYAAELPYEETEDLYEKGLIVNKHVEGNSFIAQRFALSAARKDANEAAADEDEE